MDSDAGSLDMRNLLQRLIEEVPIRIFWKDRESHYLGCNALFAKDSGLSGPADLVGRTDFDLAWRDQAESYRADDAAVMAAGTPLLGYEEPQTTPDGKTIWLRTSKAPLRGHDGAVIGVIGIYEDITAQRQLDIEYRTLMDQSLLALQVVNPDGVTVRVNPAWEKLWGVPLSALEGYNTLQDRQLVALGVMPYIRRALAGEAVTVPEIEYDREATPEVGGTTGKVWVRTFIYPVKDGDQVREIVIVQEDVGPRKAVERALIETRRRHEDAQRIAGLGHWRLDLAANDLEWSDEVFRIFGVDKAAFAPSFDAFLDVVHPDDRELVGRAYIESVDNRSGYDIVHRLLMPDGSVKWVNERCETTYADDGTALVSAGTVLDITDRRVAELALQRSGDFLGKIIDHAAEGISVCHACDEFPFVRFSLWNERMTEMTGYTMAEINALGWYQSMYPDPGLRARAVARMDRMRQGDNLIGEEWDVVTKSGDKRTFSISTSVIALEDGPPAVIGLMHDVTVRKRAEQTVGQQAEFRIKLLDQASEGIVLWRSSVGERFPEFLTWNRRMEEITGYTREEINRLGWLQVSYADPAERARARASMERILAGESGGGGDVEIVTKGGESRTVRVSASSVRGADDEPCVLEVIQDVTAARRQQAQLEASRERFSLLFDASMDGILVVRPDGVVIDANRTAHTRLGYSKQELLAMNLSELVTPEAAALLPGRIADIMSTGLTTFESSHRCRDGAALPVEVSVRAIDLDGERVLFGVVRDISERRRFEERLSQSQKMEAIGTLVGGIAHDFNNMLAAIQGNLYLARQEMLDSPVAEDKLANIEELGKRAADMVQQLLTFARKDVVSLRVGSLNQFMREGLRLAAAAIPASIEQDVSVCSEDLRVRCDTTQLQQVLMNLMTNAVDAVADVPRPRIDCSLAAFEAGVLFGQRHPEVRGERFACISVRDNGRGIPEWQVAKIFDPFFTTKEVGKGTGLGLAMVYGAVKTHGGVVEVDSAVGVGTEFRVYLPLTTEECAAGTVDQRHPARGKGETVLVVDDDENVRYVTAEVLQRLGYNVVQAVDGQVALDMLRARPDAIDIVVTDVIMPRVGGVELLKGMRGQGIVVPVILTTGYDVSHVLERDVPASGCAQLNKPYRMEDLADLVRRMLAGG